MHCGGRGQDYTNVDICPASRLDGEATEYIRTGGYTSQVPHDGIGTRNCGQSEVQKRVTNTPHSQVRHRNEATCTLTAGK